MYINFGPIPNSLIVKAYPPSCEYWGDTKRAGSVESPFRDKFRRLEMQDDDEATSLDMVDAFAWLLHFLEKEYGDEEALRNRVLAENGDLACIMPAWAQGVLKEPWEYFKEYNNAYYRKQP
jgi:hypothetical protein